MATMHCSYLEKAPEAGNPAAIVHAEKFKILRGMRHDIQTPIHALQGLVGVLAKSESLNDQQKKIISNLEINNVQLFALIDAMLDFLQGLIHEPDEEFSCIVSPSPEHDKLDETHSSPTAKQHILLVEDNTANVLLATAYLKELGYNYDVAESGMEALDKFSTIHYDAVMMDIQMPDMDGLETTRRMRSMEKKRNLAPTPIMATTGSTDNDDHLFCLKAGMNDYLAKPFLMTELGDKLQSLVTVQ